MSSVNLDDVIRRVQGLSPGRREKLIEEVVAQAEQQTWVPNPGPQTDAYYSKADLLLHGGQVVAVSPV